MNWGNSMGNQVERYKHSRRMHRKLAYIDRQMGIRKVIFGNRDPGNTLIKDEVPHRYHKLSGMTCGSSRCIMCGNPRKFFDERTMQEQRAMQDVDHIRNRHSNGKLSEDE
jgi:calcineurin-like phosphoesterase family protein